MAIALILLAALLSPCCLPAPARAEAPGDSCTTVVYSANPQYPPYHWATADGTLQGASIDLLKMVIPKGIDLRASSFPWKRVLALAERGEIDLVSLRKVPERAAYLTFTSTPAFPNPIVVFVRKDRRFPFRNWSDLKGRKGVISLGDRFGKEFDSYLRRELSVQETGTLVENFRRLDRGEADYFVTGRYTGEAFLKARPPMHPIVRLSPPVSEEGVYFGFSKKSSCAVLVDQVDRRLSELQRQGIPRRLLSNYLEHPELISYPYWGRDNWQVK